MIITMEFHFKAFNISVQGASHAKAEKVCQDASQSYSDENMAIAVVSDGHGGDKYMRSDRGAKFAAEIAMKAMQQFISSIEGRDVDPQKTWLSLNCFKEWFVKKETPLTGVELIKNCQDKLLTHLISYIIAEWNNRIETDWKNNPVQNGEIAGLPKEIQEKYTTNTDFESAYGTTLIAVARTADYFIGIQIGDGKCVCMDASGVFSQPIPWDDKCFLNMTTSICDKNALSYFRTYCSFENLPAAVFIASDGVDDTFGDGEELYAFYRTVNQLFAKKEWETAKKELEEYLPTLSEKGSQDDISIAAIIDIGSNFCLSQNIELQTK